MSLQWKLDGTPLVPCVYARDFWDILCQAALTVGVLARLGWASVGTGGGNGVASGLNAYNLQTLIQYDPIYTKIWVRSGKNLVHRGPL